jgi:predicted metal-dependent enzyme (double-stranded beta helix superfamily)
MTVTAFDPDALVDDCLTATTADQPVLAVRDALRRALAAPAAVAGVLGRERAGIESLHTSDGLTVLNVVWAPGMRLFPHDHRMWAVIGIYGGAEDNEFFGRTPTGLRSTGGASVTERDVLLLGDEAIHAVTNPRSTFTGAIHVYGGDFFTTPRSEWDPETLEERPWDVEHARQVFAAANEAVRGDR